MSTGVPWDCLANMLTVVKDVMKPNSVIVHWA